MERGTKPLRNHLRGSAAAPRRKLTQASLVPTCVDTKRFTGPDQHRNGASGAEKNDIQPWIVQSWCIPPKANAEFVWRMEDVIQTYMLPYDPKYPVVCFDEASRQLFGEVRPPEPARPGAAARIDYEYERKGVCCQLVMCEPLRGWRHVTVTERRTRKDYARCIRDLVYRYFPRVTKV